MSLGQKFWYDVKDLVTKNKLVKYDIQWLRTCIRKSKKKRTHRAVHTVSPRYPGEKMQ